MIQYQKLNMHSLMESKVNCSKHSIIIYKLENKATISNKNSLGLLEWFATTIKNKIPNVIITTISAKNKQITNIMT